MGEYEWRALPAQGWRNKRPPQRKHAKLWGALKLHCLRAHGSWTSGRQRVVLQLAAVFRLRPVGGGQWLECGVSGEKRPGHTKDPEQLAAVREPQPLQQRADGIEPDLPPWRVPRLQ